MSSKKSSLYFLCSGVSLPLLLLLRLLLFSALSNSSASKASSVVESCLLAPSADTSSSSSSSSPSLPSPSPSSRSSSSSSSPMSPSPPFPPDRFGTFPLCTMSRYQIPSRKPYLLKREYQNNDFDFSPFVVIFFVSHMMWSSTSMKSSSMEKMSSEMLRERTDTRKVV